MKPEAKIQSALVDYLTARSWLVERMHGNAYQRGVPDLYCYREGEHRWIDVKVAGRYSFTPAQRHKWLIWDSFGVGIWILTGACQSEYNKLFEPPNWREFWRERWGPIKPEINWHELQKQTD